MTRLLFFLVALMLPFATFSQCTTTNATSCQCLNGGTNCDLLPDMHVGRPPLLVSGSAGSIEYPQLCNPPCSGNDGRLRISVTTPNIGFGPLEIRALPVAICGTDTFYNVASTFTCPNGQLLKQLVVQRIYQKNGNTMNFYDRTAGSMTYHPTHGHMHVDDWGFYSLRTATADPNPLNWPVVGTGSKLAFCLMDYGSCSTYNGHCTTNSGVVLTNGNFPNFGLGGGQYGCSPAVQGISSGYTDIYYQSLDGMWINVPPGICNGTYWIVVQLDPYNYFLESDETNNVIAVPVTLTQQGGTPPVISASGSTTFCQGGSVSLTASPANSYLWSNGATTQSITVSQAGSYSVSINSGSNCSSVSAPVTVNVNPLPVAITATPSAICTGGSTQLNTNVTASGTGNAPVTFSSFTSTSIPDANSTGAASLISVTGIDPATINSGTIISVTVNITHPNVGDLLVQLVSPSQNVINLSNQRGGNGDNFINTVFSSSAASFIYQGVAPFSGSFKPDGAFSAFSGNSNGTWVLRVSDLVTNNIGTINSWSITLNDVQNTSMTYSWSSSPAGFTSTSANPVVSPTVNTNYTVFVTESITGCTGTQSVNVTMGNTINVTTNSPATICAGTSTVLNANGALSYSWFPTTGLSSSTGASVNASPAATTTYRVIGNAGGCLDTTFVTVNVDPLPGTPGLINGSAKACPGNTITYSCPPVTGVTSYVWTAPANATIISGQGTNSITVLYNTGFTGGLISVKGVNACGDGNSASKSILPDMPLTPSTISGNASGTCGSQETYTVAAVAGISINWTVPTGASVVSGQGTSSAVVSLSNTFPGGIISAVAQNSCGSSSARTLSIKGAPSEPAPVAGSTVVCQGQKGVAYSVPTPYGASTYSWLMPATINIASGQGTNSILVNYANNATSTKFRVRAANSCGTSNSAGFQVKVNSCNKFGAPESDGVGTVQIMPNPAGSFTELRFESTGTEPVEVTLINMLGQQVYRKVITPVSGINQNRIDLRNLKAGVYVISLVRKNGTYTERLVVE